MIVFNQDESRIVAYIKEHIQLVLQQMEDFYPFGAVIKTDGTLEPVIAYLDEDNLSVQALITNLEQTIADSFLEKSISLGAVAIAVQVFERGEDQDGVQIRFYKAGEDPDHVSISYRKVPGGIEFL